MNVTVNEWWIEGGANLSDGKFTRNKIFRVSEVNKFRFQYGNCGVFVTAYQYSCPDQKEALLTGDFYLDIDSEDISNAQEDAITAVRYINRMYGVGPNIVQIYFSGKKGFHIIVPREVFGIEPSKDLHRIFKLMAEEISNSTKHKAIDLKIYDSRRLLRLPNSKHPSTGLYKIPLSFSELNELTSEEIAQLAQEPRCIPHNEAKAIPMAQLAFNNFKKRIIMQQPSITQYTGKPLDYVPPCIGKLLDEPVRSGQRNNSAAALASFFKQQQMNVDEIQQRMREWNELRCNPPMGETEINAVVHSVSRGEYKMGCTWLETLVDCDKTKCKLKKRR